MASASEAARLVGLLQELDDSSPAVVAIPLNSVTPAEGSEVTGVADKPKDDDLSSAGVSNAAAQEDGAAQNNEADVGGQAEGGAAASASTENQQDSSVSAPSGAAGAAAEVAAAFAAAFAAAPAPAPPPKPDYTIESDEAWLHENGSSTYQGSAGANAEYSVFRNDASGELYWMHRATGVRTWDCPPALLAEMKSIHAGAGADEYAYEGLGADFENNGPWVPPSLAKAEAYKAREVYAAGKASFCGTRDADLAQMGVGVALYFRLLKSLAILFVILSVLAVPGFMFHSHGSRLPGRVPDPLRFARISLGNLGSVGLDAVEAVQTAAEKAAAAVAAAFNITDSSWLTSNSTDTAAAASVDTLVEDNVFLDLPDVGFYLQGNMGSYILTALDLGSVLIVLLFAVVLRNQMASFVSYSERKKVSAADYSIYVQGLPPNVTVEELRDHFATLFALDGEGVTATGVYVSPEQRSATAMAAAGATVHPSPTRPLALASPASGFADTSVVHMPGPANPNLKALNKAATAARKAIEKRRRHGVVTDVDPDASFAHRMDVLARGKVSDTGYSGDLTFHGSWVAAVHIVRPVGDIIRTFGSAQKLTQKVREARARVKMYAPDTPAAAGPSPAKHAKALEVVGKLSAELEMLRSSLVRRRKGRVYLPDSNGGGGGGRLLEPCVGSAYITFNCEESLQRCLKAYQMSGLSLLRYFQPMALRFRCPAAPGYYSVDGQAVKRDAAGRIDYRTYRKEAWCNYGAGFPLHVQQAPDPSDVIHENLEVTAGGRCVRQMITTFITFCVVVIGLVMMVVAQGYSSTLAKTRPDLSMCETELPALFLGGYDNVTAAKTLWAQGYGRPQAVNTAPIRSLQQVAQEYTSGNNNAMGAFLRRHGGGGGRSLAISTQNDAAVAATTKLPLTRQGTAVARSLEDAMCPSGRYSIAYRLDFNDVPLTVREDYSSAPYPSFNSSTTGVTYPRGTAVPYGTAVNVACNIANVRSMAALVDPLFDMGIPADSACPDPRVLSGQNALGYCPCVAPAAADLCKTLPCFKPELEDEVHQCSEFTAATITGCYCTEALTTYMNDLGTFKGLLSFNDRESDVCGEFVSSYVITQALIILAGAAASVVNVLLSIIIPKLANMEGHVSLSAKGHALAVKLAAAQSINTAITAVIVNARLPRGIGYKIPGAISNIGVLNGRFGDFTSEWYAVVGTTICTTALTNTLIPPVMMAVEYISDSCSRVSARRKEGYVVNQEQLDELFVGARFNVPSRYPLILTMLTVSLFYSTGIPLLLPLAAIGFTLQYLVDKYMLLRFYRKPPSFDASLALLVTKIIPYLLLAHLGFGLWMVSTEGLLPSGTLTTAALSEAVSSFNDVGAAADSGVATSYFAAYLKVAAAYDPIGALPRILKLNALPYFLFMILLLVALLLNNVLYGLYSFLHGLVYYLTCGFVCCAACGRRMPAHMRQRVRKAMRNGAAADPFLEIVAAYRKFPRTMQGLLYESLWVRTVRSLTAKLIGMAPAGGEAAAHGSGAPLHDSHHTPAHGDHTAFIALDGETTGSGKGLAPYSSEFSRIHDPVSAGTTLTGVEVAQGWRLQVVDAKTLNDVTAEDAVEQWRAVVAAVDAGGGGKPERALAAELATAVNTHSPLIAQPSQQSQQSHPMSPGSRNDAFVQPADSGTPARLAEGGEAAGSSSSPGSNASPHSPHSPHSPQQQHDPSHSHGHTLQGVAAAALVGAGFGNAHGHVVPRAAALSKALLGNSSAVLQQLDAATAASSQRASFRKLSVSLRGGSAPIVPIVSPADESGESRESQGDSSHEAPAESSATAAADGAAGAAIPETEAAHAEPATAAGDAAADAAPETEAPEVQVPMHRVPSSAADEDLDDHEAYDAVLSMRASISAASGSSASPHTSSESSFTPGRGGAEGSRTAAALSGKKAGPPVPESRIYVLRKLWTVEGEGHHKGAAKRSWEVISDTGLCSYEPENNPLYRAAFLAAAEQVADEEEEEAEALEAEKEAARRSRLEAGEEDEEEEANEEEEGGEQDEEGDGEEEGDDGQADEPAVPETAAARIVAAAIAAEPLQVMSVSEGEQRALEGAQA